MERNKRLTLEALGIDPYTFQWQDLASCVGLDVNLFFDKYEKYKSIAEQTDNTCLRCPVIVECFNDGQYNEETGVRGGFYLTKGVVDPAKNRHKTDEMKKLLSIRLLGDENV